MQTAKRKLKELIETSPITEGMTIRVRGSHIYLGREDPPGPYASDEPDDRVRLTHLGGTRFGLSVRRHTGRWEKTPFSGTLEEVVGVIWTTMQHLVSGL
jgi:hypothetical protein